MNILLILLFFQICCYLIYKNEKVQINEISNNIKVKYIEQINKIKNDDNIGKIVISKIGVNNNLYDLNNSKNNVNQNVTILKGSIYPDKENSIMFIAAHSGSGSIAYFKNLNKLTNQDEVIIYYKDKKYKYIVTDKWESNKDGDIEVTKTNNKQLILTTCSPKNKNKQLIINCTLKES